MPNAVSPPTTRTRPPDGLQGESSFKPSVAESFLSDARRPLTVAILFFFVVTLTLSLVAWHMCQGVWTYAFDDAYIHLAMAHNLAFSGVWGVSSNSFASASSSPIWTVILAAILRVCNIDLVPLVLNIGGGVATLSVVAHAWQRAWRSELFTVKTRTVGLIVLCVVVPLPVLALIGMEHSFQLLFSLCFLYNASRALGEQQSARKLPLWAFLMGGIRFEGAFLALWTALALARQKRFLAAGAVFGSALVPFVLHGLMARSQGWAFVPASVALKRDIIPLTVPGILLWLEGLGLRSMSAWPLTVMALAAYFVARRVSSPSLRVALPLFALATMSHVFLALCNSFYRYEAYLFGLGVALLWPTLLEVVPRDRTYSAMKFQLVAIVVFSGWIVRASGAMVLAPFASRNIYFQQKQMTGFIHRYYPDETVALNDIGTTDWAATNRPDGHAAFDLFGLGEREVAMTRLRQADMKLPAAAAHRLIEARNIRLAIVYDDWFAPNIFPSDWVRVAQWHTGPRIVSGFDRVSFWTPKSNAARLHAQLQEFEKDLPPGVDTIWIKPATRK